MRIRLLVRLLDTGLSWFRLSCWVLATLGILAGLQLTMRSSSNVEAVWWMPAEIGRWCEEHGRLRNLHAFFLLGVPFLVALRRPNQRIAATVVLSIFGASLEFFQLAIPGRWFEWQDIALTWSGLWLAWLFSETARGLLRRLRSFAERKRQYGYASFTAHELSR